MKVWRGFYAYEHHVCCGKEWRDEMLEYPELTIPEAIRRLNADNVSIRIRIDSACILSEFDDRRLVKHVEPLLFEGDKDDRWIVAKLLVVYFRDPLGLPFILDRLGRNEANCSVMDYNTLFEIMDNRKTFVSPNYDYELWRTTKLSDERLAEKQKLLDQCHAWFRENGRYLEYTSTWRDTGFWRINQEAKQAGVPVRVWKEMPDDTRKTWNELPTPEREQAVKTAREKVGRIIEIIDML
jgi:hypothetical protein